jgi:hypothetical protein
MKSSTRPKLTSCDRSFLRRLALTCAGGAALLLCGCVTASPSSPAAMTTVAAAPVAAKHTESLGVTVTGGSETSALGASKISNEDFAEAIKNSIGQSGLFAKIVSTGQSDYQLDVQIVRLDQPMFGTSFTVNLEATWRLMHSGDQKLIWEKAITSSSTATFSEAFSGVTRLRLANEGAARNNIQEAIADMSALALP